MELIPDIDDYIFNSKKCCKTLKENSDSVFYSHALPSTFIQNKLLSQKLCRTKTELCTKY